MAAPTTHTKSDRDRKSQQKVDAHANLYYRVGLYDGHSKMQRTYVRVSNIREKESAPGKMNIRQKSWDYG